MDSFIPLQNKKAFVNFPYFIASRLSSHSLTAYARPLIRIATAGVALSIAVMLISVAVVRGFQQEIQAKVFGFSGHIRISSFDLNDSYESSPLDIDQVFFPDYSGFSEVEHIQPFATKAGILKTEEHIEGVVLKGIDGSFDRARFSGTLLRGYFPDIGGERSDDVLVSERIALRLGLDTGQYLRMYFLSGSDGNLRGRRFVISGIYRSGMEEFDRTYILGDLRHIQRLNKWDSTEVGGFEVFVKNVKLVDEVASELYKETGADIDVLTASSLYPQIFDWLALQDMNVVIILVLMIFVSAITMVSALLIIILERMGLIGVLKSLGANNAMIRQIFLHQAIRISLSGLLFGNVTGLLLLFLQQKFGWIRLSEESYYLSTVPVSFELLPILFLNFGAIVICILAMLLPAMIISRVNAVKIIAMR